MNFTKFGIFWVNVQKNNGIGFSEQLFKAEMVRFREHFPNFSKFQLFARKTFFLRKSGSGVKFPTFLVQNALLRLGASKKTSQELVFIKVSEPGSQKTDSGPKSQLRAPEMLKMWNSAIFLVK